MRSRRSHLVVIVIVGCQLVAVKRAIIIVRSEVWSGTVVVIVRRVIVVVLRIPNNGRAIDHQFSFHLLTLITKYA